MHFIGIDPGLEGAIADFDSETVTMSIMDMPLIPVMRGKKAKEEVDRNGFKRILQQFDPRQTHVFYEQLWGFAAERDQQGQFFFARDYGVLLGIIASLELPSTGVPPQTWQNAVGKKGKEKIYSVERFVQLYPGVGLVKPGCRTPHPDRAEAGLLAHYGRITTHTQLRHQ
ncbi:MAG: hypothetical protein K2W95_15880 [Candidatus Obscuribacterales bacterium]|nr:hypothetical protein [Candidatus Obscuribacterales bacterium]